MNGAKQTLGKATLLKSLMAACLLLVALGPLQAEAKGKALRAPLALPMGQVAASGAFAPLPAVQQYQKTQPSAPIWLASNVDSAYLAGVRDGRYATLKQIKAAIQAFTGAPVKRVLSIAMISGVLVLSVEDVYSNIFNVRVQPETAAVLP